MPPPRLTPDDKPTVLVTGGAGFLGRHLVVALITAGFHVRVFDRIPFDPALELPESIDYVQGDIRDRSAVAAALVECWGVCHLAGVPQLWAKPRGLFEQIHVEGTINVLEEAVTAGCQRLLHLSTVAVWPEGGWRSDGVDSRRLADAEGPYSRSKLRAERIALDMARKGAPIVVVSPALPLGPGDPNLTPPTQLLLDYFTHPRREYLPADVTVIDVRDLAQGMVKALVLGELGRPYLLGSMNVSLPELVGGLGIPAPTRQVPYRLALAGARVSEWLSSLAFKRRPFTTVEAVRLTKRLGIANPSADLRELGVVPRPLDHTLNDVAAWFRAMGFAPPAELRL